MNYRYVRDDKREVYKVVELNTDQVIFTSRNFDDARKITRLWNTGGGFKGWTPRFFLQDVPAFYSRPI